ncbi:MAG: helix-turn-helix domain-containing protein, partial [Bacteroidota bacterium]
MGENDLVIAHPINVMPDFFDPHLNQADVAAKTLVVFDRIAEVLRVQLWETAKQYGLTPLQIRTLQFIKHRAPDEVTVSLLAETFQLTKPTVSETVRLLVKKQYVEKIRSQEDGRSFVLCVLPTGLRILDQ